MLRVTIIWNLLLLSLVSHSQVLDIYQGNKAYENGSLEEAHKYYEQALTENPSLYEGNYNLGNTEYKSGKADEAIQRYEQAVASAKNEQQKANALHNLGNSYFQKQEFEKSVKAYKDALRTNPNDDETRYNLAYAQQMLKQQQQQQEQEQEQNEKQEQEQNSDQDKKQEDQDQNKQEDGDSSDKEEQKKNQKQDKSDQEKGEEEKPAQKQPKPINLSPREAEQLLEAAKEQDQQIQMQLKKNNQKANPRKIEKDW